MYTDGDAEISTELKRLLETDKDAANGRIHVEDRKITRLAKSTDSGVSGIVLSFVDGQSVSEGFLVHQPTTKLRGSFAQQLGLELQPSGDIMVKMPFNETSESGVFAVGDCATPLKAVSQAVAMGTLAAGGIAFQLGAELAKIK